jgi:hypothetical protein
LNKIRTVAVMKRGRIRNQRAPHLPISTGSKRKMLERGDDGGGALFPLWPEVFTIRPGEM